MNKTIKRVNAAISLHLLSTVSAVAVEQANSNSVPSAPLPFFADISSGSKPAVDGVNGKIQIDGGAAQANGVSISGIPGLSPSRKSSNNWNSTGGGIGTITIPIGHSFGAQLDMGAGALGKRPLGEASGHLFWRDPEKGLVGVYGSGMLLGSKVGRGVWTAAGEFEAYIGRFTGSAIIGVQGASGYTGNVSARYINGHGNKSVFNIADYFHDQVEATFYPLDDLALSVGHIYSFNRNAVTGEIEYLLPEFRGGNIAPSAFISGAYGWNNSSNIMAGIRVYFGNYDKSLIRRHREDDPRVRRQYAKPRIKRMGIDYGPGCKYGTMSDNICRDRTSCTANCPPPHCPGSNSYTVSSGATSHPVHHCVRN